MGEGVVLLSRLRGQVGHAGRIAPLRRRVLLLASGRKAVGEGLVGMRLVFIPILIRRPASGASRGDWPNGNLASNA